MFGSGSSHGCCWATGGVSEPAGLRVSEEAAAAAAAAGTFTGISPKGLLPCVVVVAAAAVFFIEKSSGGCLTAAAAAATSSVHELVDDTAGSSQ